MPIDPLSPQSRIADVRGVRIASGARDASRPAPGVEDLGSLRQPPAPHTTSPEALVDFTVRLSAAEIELIRAYGIHLIAERDAIARGEKEPSPEPEDPMQRIVDSWATALVEAEVTTLTPDERGRDSDCINAYFCNFAPDELAAVDAVVTRIPALDPNCKASICIPVAAHEEGKHIYRTLKAFSRQTVDSSTFEIVLYLNHPEARMDGTPVVPDETMAEVARFQGDFPHLRVHAFYSTLPLEQARIGLIRKFLTDVVVMRQYRRGTAGPDLILIRTDADTHGVKSEYIENYVHLFEKHPHVDAFKGKLDWDWPGYLKDPVLLFGTRLFLALDAYIDSIDRNIGGGGANFAIRAARYADLGGYNPDSKMAEDVQLGTALKGLRLGATEHIAIRSAGARSRLWTDNRRGAAALRKGHAPVCQWHNPDTEFGADNRDIRAVPAGEVGKSFLELLHAEDFHTRVTLVLQQTLDFYMLRNDPKRKEYVKNVLPKLGLQAEVDEEGIVAMGDISGLMRFLAAFHAAAPRYWSEHLGFDPV